MGIFKQVLTLLTISALCFVHGKVTLHSFKDCDPNADYPIKMNFKLKEGEGMQIIEEGTLSSKVPLGNNIQEIIEVYSKEDKGEYEHLITIKESLCEAVNKYMGEFIHEMQKSAGLEPGTCPIPAGDYKITDHTLDFQKLKFKKIPEGDFKVETYLMDVTTNATLNCHELEFTLVK